MPSPSHLRAYLQEAACLGGFVLLAGLLTIGLEHPDGPAQHTVLKAHPVVRHALLGVGIGAYTWGTAAVLSKRSGAHANPSVTLAFLLLGRIRGRDALGYIAAQTAGATAAVFLLKAGLYRWFSHPAVHFGVTRPQPPHGQADAFVAEALISAITMAALLATAGSRKFSAWGPGLLAVLLAVFLTVELPYSGMSMNPARSFAGDAAAGDFSHLWIYCVAPVGAMAVIAALYPAVRRWARRWPAAAADEKSLPFFPAAGDTPAVR